MKKILLIHPPFVGSNILPLGIPTLTAYLKHKGIGDVEVLDLNTALWKTQGTSWTLYKLLNRGVEVLKGKGPMFDPLQDMMAAKIEAFLEDMGNGARRMLPLSLKATLASSDDQDPSSPQRRLVRSLLGPVLSGEAFEFVGISAIFPDQLLFSLLIARELKEAWGERVRIILGGAQVTKNSEFLVRGNGADRWIDYLVAGDGEEALFRLLTRPQEEDLSSIPNLYFKDPAGRGGYVRSAATYARDPADALIPDFSGFDRQVYQKTLPVIISRGCSWGRCTFCSFSGYAGRKDQGYVCSSTDKSIEILRGMQQKYGVSEFSFFDNTLMSGFMKTLAEALIREKMGIRWYANINLSRDFVDPEFCRLLKRSGLFAVWFGLESVSRRILKLMNKYHQAMSPEEMKEILGVIKGEGIRIGVYALFGFPTETREEAGATLDFLIQNITLFDRVSMNPFFLDDFTKIFDEPEKFGITKVDKEDKPRLTSQRLTYAFETKEGMDRAEVDAFIGEAFPRLKRAFEESRGKKRNP